ncbi:MAG TPA: phosphodiester glycosidase family protein [Vicinamibacterales bacterium]|nr:phosphodiester glycosidase family protein [Vicinamibacterales bacterium]HOQ60385.1 phosphodiester glycosidase family protein [Vicinamibacterales bacterium]HPK70367.1 phosphodiester glycosidase family protein [Vicinamibacterales bacterium]
MRRRPAALSQLVLPALAVLALAAAGASCWTGGAPDLGAPQRIADGVRLYRLHDPALIEPAGPIAVQVLRLDPSKVDLRSALPGGRVVQLDTVLGIARREGAVAAVNAGFFVLKTGDPAGVLEVGGELVSDSPLTRGAVGIVREAGKPLSLVFDRLAATVTLRYATDDGRVARRVDGVDTTRARGKLMLYTPRYGPDSDTAGTGVEWQLAGSPLRVVRRARAGKTPIPRGGAVLSYGGTDLPSDLEALEPGREVALVTEFRPLLGTTPEQWARAQDIVGGAGLLVHRGKPLTDWSSEQLAPRFDADRHPRTMIGATRDGTIWMVTVDGRNPMLSLGMSFPELQGLARRLGLHDALNLDGGGSTTMVAGGSVVNHPSDAQGPRRVSDALVVVPKR